MSSPRAAQYTDQVLVQAALDGQPPDAVRALVDHLSPVVQARVARILLNRRGQARARDVRQEIEDLSQEVFLSLLDRDGRILRAWDATKGLSLRNFVGLVAERQVLSILRSGRRSPWTEDPTLDTEMDLGATGQAADQEARVTQRDLLEKLFDRVREHLSPQGMQLFDLIIVQQADPSAICESLSMTANAVYAWRSRLKKLVTRLAAEIAAEEGEGVSGRAAPPRNSRQDGTP